MNNENRAWQWASHLILIVISLSCIIPFALLFMSSISEETSITKYGYQLFPKAYSFDAYSYLWKNASSILHAYGITIMITVIGTAVGLAMTAMLAYPASRKDYPFYKGLAFFVFFTLLFNGGLVPTYLIYTQYLDMKDTIWALIIPNLLMNGFNVLLMRTFFMTTIPAPVIESANMDGAGEVRTFTSIVLPLSMPILATVGLMQAIMYWNDWFNGMVYITEPQYFSLQNVLNQILSNINFLSTTNMSAATNVTMNLPGATVRMAIAAIGVIPMLLAYPFFQKYFIKGITIGAVKG
ncbi:carbohydrate ABC transporter permease [Paenibacillus periandrae]|uniref:carbohydrate ABC transporter permease n=1 Tax=Paenibacillus periandrae TaxID=1761741 RepID=UPI001F09E881|nr:carbohydrate ABC transporter permease [Paenibacillus periandrae]